MEQHLTTIQIISVSILPILFAVTVHEVAHGYAAYLLGDQTARVLGRLTLNPVKHIDIFGTIIVPATLLLLNAGVVLGWAKPVPINPYNFKHPRRDSQLVALAGPASNFIMAIIWGGILKGSFILFEHNIPGALAIIEMSKIGIIINLVLMVFNLLPLPPLDGGHIVAGLLPKKLAYRYEQIAPFGFFILLLLVSIGVVGMVVNPIISFLWRFIVLLFGL